MEFSKKILLCVAAGTFLVVIGAYVLMWRTGDLTALQAIIAGCFTELATGTGFYYWKARAENVRKIDQAGQAKAQQHSERFDPEFYTKGLTDDENQLETEAQQP